MWHHYLKSSLRFLRKNSAFTFINIFGLAVGMACCMIIFQYAQFELSYDQYHAQKDRTYRLINQEGSFTGEGIAKVAGPWAPALAENFAEVESYVRLRFFSNTLIASDSLQAYEGEGLYADASIFDIFSFIWISGDPATALNHPNQVVITQSMAQRYFGNREAVGQTLQFDGDRVMQVSGVLEDVPENTHFTFSFLVSHTYDTSDLIEQWNRNQYYSYLLIQPSADNSITQDFDEFLQSRISEIDIPAYTALQPLTSIHLHSQLFREMAPNGSLTSVLLFCGVAILILIVACINFVNLTTAQSSYRTKEVGVRKTIGARRGQVAWQFLHESLLIGFAALILAVSLAYWLTPWVNQQLALSLNPAIWDNGPLFLALLGIFLIVSTVAGSYPALLLSRLSGITASKAKDGTSRMRQFLVVGQFAVAVLLITTVVVVYAQRKYISQKALGFNKEQIVTIPLRDSSMRAQYETLKQTLRQNPGVMSVSVSANLPGGGDWGIPTEPEGFAEEDVPDIRMLVVDHDFLDTYQMKLVQGRTFEAERADDTKNYLLNEEAARQLGWEEPIGKQMAMSRIGRETGEVIGVVQDFHFRSLHEQIQPLIFFIQPNWLSTVSLRVHPGQLPETLAFLEETWQQADPVHPFTYSFLDDTFAQLYASEARMSWLMSSLTVVAIMLACLGLLGLVAYSVRKRTKEIGIRKVLGASVGQIVWLLTQDFAKLIAIAVILASPAAWWLLQQWLTNFAYRIDLHVGYLLLAGGITVFIAFLTLSSQSVWAARANPVKALQDE